MKRNKNNKNKWYDHYAQRARKEGFPARSVYKLQEIQDRLSVLKPRNRVLDLGCSPGSWLLFASRIVGKEGFVLGVDLKPLSIPLPPNASFIQGDIMELKDEPLIRLGGDFDVVLSDVSPSTTGHRFVDAQRSVDLCEAVLAISHHVLKQGGIFVCKIFQGIDFKEFSDKVKKDFEHSRSFRPKSTRKGSKEIYVLGSGKK
nr:RlmE family RNA methyltransferase [Desulfobacterales bacterium]